jgi:hypothetical protein
MESLMFLILEWFSYGAGAQAKRVGGTPNHNQTFLVKRQG